MLSSGRRNVLNKLLEKLEEKRKEFIDAQKSSGIGELKGIKDVMQKRDAKYNLPKDKK